MHSKHRLLPKLFTGLLCTNHIMGFMLLTEEGNYLFKRQWKQGNDFASHHLTPAKSRADFPLGGGAMGEAPLRLPKCPMGRGTAGAWQRL